MIPYAGKETEGNGLERQARSKNGDPRKPILFRLRPELHRDLRKAATQENRSVGNLVETLLMDGLKNRGKSK